MQQGRLFEILYFLVEKRHITAKELAERFEVSARTIYRDIDALSGAGIPVYTQKGHGGGIRLMDGFVLDRTLLSAQEQGEILLGLRTLTAAHAMEDDQTLRRMAALFRCDSADWLDVDFVQWGGAEEQRETFARVKQAILNRHILAFDYYGTNGTCTRRRVEPMRLRFKGGNWYVHAYCLCRQAFRLFRLSRMEGVEVEPASFAPRPGLPVTLEAADGSPSPPMAHLRLRFDAGAAYRVRDTFHPRCITALPDGTLYVETDFPEDGWVTGFLLSFGPQVEVLAPAHIRTQLQHMLVNMQQIYQTGHKTSDLCGYNQAKSREEPMMEHMEFCQCCGMPLSEEADRGREADGRANMDYCRYCFQDGAFVQPDMTMEQMIAWNLDFNEKNGRPFGPPEQARAQMEAWFPTLKRWRKA